MNKILLSYFLCLIMVASASAGGRAPSGKPLPPLQVSIAPDIEGLTPAQIKPGDIVSFTVTAVSFLDAEEMRIDVDLTGGVRLVAGDTSWTGPMKKGEERKMLLTVQAPEHGSGNIRARVSLPSSKGARFSAEAHFELGQKAEKNEEQKPVTKKDSKGRDVIEYR